MKRLLVIGFILCAAGFAAIFVWINSYMARDRSLIELPAPPVRDELAGRDQELVIGLIGDSWVEVEGVGRSMEEYFRESGVPATVVSSGQSGATSKQIYRNLVENHGGIHSAYSMLMDERMDYLVIIAGVNDTARHMGSDYYAHHMMGMIRAIMSRGISPVVLDVPEYGIEDATAKSFVRAGKRMVYRYLVDGGEVDVIRRYRDALDKAISRLPEGSVLQVRFDGFVDDYRARVDWYEDAEHLNEEGRQALGRWIAGAIEGEG